MKRYLLIFTVLMLLLAMLSSCVFIGDSIKGDKDDGNDEGSSDTEGSGSNDTEGGDSGGEGDGDGEGGGDGEGNDGEGEDDDKTFIDPGGWTNPNE